MFSSFKINKQLTVDKLNVHFSHMKSCYAHSTQYIINLYGTPLSLIIFRTLAEEVLFPTFLKNYWS